MSITQGDNDMQGALTGLRDYQRKKALEMDRAGAISGPLSMAADQYKPKKVTEENRERRNPFVPTLGGLVGALGGIVLAKYLRHAMSPELPKPSPAELHWPSPAELRWPSPPSNWT